MTILSIFYTHSSSTACNQDQNIDRALNITNRDALILLGTAAAMTGALGYGAYRTYRYFRPAPVNTNPQPTDTRSTYEKVTQELKESAKIYGLSVAAATAYGIVLDQFTYRHCPEYFTKNFHKDMMDRWEGQPILGQAKKLFDNNPNNPTLRAAIWGTVASWWMGAILGVPITLACRLGSWKKLTYKDIAKPMAITMGLTGISSAYSGFTEHKHLQLYEKILAQRPANKGLSIFYIPQNLGLDDVTDAHGFKVNGAAHNAAYLNGPLWSLGLIFYILKKRYDLSHPASANNQTTNQNSHAKPKTLH